MIATDKDVRAWARKLDLRVGQRGKVRRVIWEAYLETHPEASN